MDAALIEAVARAMCSADGEDPDALVSPSTTPAIDMQTANIFSPFDAFKIACPKQPRWKQYERLARRQIAANEAMLSFHDQQLKRIQTAQEAALKQLADKVVLPTAVEALNDYIKTKGSEHGILPKVRLEGDLKLLQTPPSRERDAISTGYPAFGGTPAPGHHTRDDHPGAASSVAAEKERQVDLALSRYAERACKPVTVY